MPTTLPLPLVGDDLPVRCADGAERPGLNLDAAASTGCLPSVAERVADFLPSYASVHRGAGFKSQCSTAAYESAREAALAFAGGPGQLDRFALFCRNTTEAVNHLAHALHLRQDDVVVTTVVEHHANLLPWTRACRTRFVDTAPDGAFRADDVAAALDAVTSEAGTRPRLLAITAASNVSGWTPPVEAIIEAAHRRGVPVFVDGAQVAAHQPLPAEADFVAWSGHKMYAPFGTGVLVGRRDAFGEGDPFLAGGGAIDFVTLDEVVWSAPPEREEAGSPDVVGAVALHGAIDALEGVGWSAIADHDRQLAEQLRAGLAGIPGVRMLGPGDGVLPLATFTVEGVPHALVAARLATEHAISVRHGCFCAHPYLARLLGLGADDVDAFRRAVAAGDLRRAPGAVRASAGINTRAEDIDRFLAALAAIAGGQPAPVDYLQDRATGDFRPVSPLPGWPA